MLKLKLTTKEKMEMIISATLICSIRRVYGSFLCRGYGGSK
jgi:hypothetical protein